MRNLKRIVAVLHIFLEGQTTCNVVKGESTEVKEHWKADYKGQLAGMLEKIVPKNQKVFTTEKDFEITTFKDAQRMELSLETWLYYSTPKVVKGKHIKNIPSLSTMRAYGLTNKDFVKDTSKKMNLNAHEENLLYVQPDDLARFLLYCVDVVATVTGNSNVTPQDFKLEILEDIELD